MTIDSEDPTDPGIKVHQVELLTRQGSVTMSQNDQAYAEPPQRLKFRGILVMMVSNFLLVFGFYD